MRLWDSADASSIPTKPEQPQVAFSLTALRLWQMARRNALGKFCRIQRLPGRRVYHVSDRKFAPRLFMFIGLFQQAPSSSWERITTQAAVGSRLILINSPFAIIVGSNLWLRSKLCSGLGIERRSATPVGRYGPGRLYSRPTATPWGLLKQFNKHETLKPEFLWPFSSILRRWVGRNARCHHLNATNPSLRPPGDSNRL